MKIDEIPLRKETNHMKKMTPAGAPISPFEQRDPALAILRERHAASRLLFFGKEAVHGLRNKTWQ